MSAIVHLGDCLEVMKTLESGSIDMILCDLPYGTTACSWDSIIPFAPLWEQYERLIKPNGAIVLTASQPFTSALVMSNPKLFRYEWVWQKTLAANFMQMSYQPAKHHENVLVFYKKTPTYNPQLQEGLPYSDVPRVRTADVYGAAASVKVKKGIDNNGTRYPSSVQRFPNPNNNNVHPTQKPIALFEYLIRTYTEPGALILDNCAGSGTTGVAAIQCGRRAILIEQDAEYYAIAQRRVANAQPALLGIG